MGLSHPLLSPLSKEEEEEEQLQQPVAPFSASASVSAAAAKVGYRQRERERDLLSSPSFLPLSPPLIPVKVLSPPPFSTCVRATFPSSPQLNPHHAFAGPTYRTTQPAVSRVFSCVRSGVGEWESDRWWNFSNFLSPLRSCSDLSVRGGREEVFRQNFLN